MATTSTGCGLTRPSSWPADACRTPAADLCSQPTISRWENAPSLREIIRLTYALDRYLVQELREAAKRSWCWTSTIRVDIVHGHQQLAQWNAHYDERCFLPIHIYDTATGRAGGGDPAPRQDAIGQGSAQLLSRLVRHIRRHWPDTHITIRGDSHYGREEAMTWCENNGMDYIFGLSGNVVLDRLVEAAADDIRVRRAEGRLRCCVAMPRPAMRPSRGPGNAGSWRGSRPAPARRTICCAGASISATSSPRCRAATPRIIYATLYCARGQAENLIKQHKAQIASDRTSCRSPLANQMRLILHTAAYWLLLDLRDCEPVLEPARHTEFATIRLRLLKVAGRIIETASRIRVSLASCCPEADTFSLVALKLQPSGP